jgi:hypothetical protein
LANKRRDTSKVLPFPSIAQPSIEDVLDGFLKDQRQRLKPRTFQRYEEVIDLLRHCLNGYGHHELDRSSEVTLYERLYFQKNIEFCAIFGPDKIPPALNNFLNYFMIRKVMATEALLQAAGTVMRKLVKWLEEHGHIGKEEAINGEQIASEATRELPAAERLARLLYNFAQHYAPRHWTDELDDYFTIEEVKPDTLILSGASMSGVVEVRVPQEISDHCKEGWMVNLLLGKTPHGWCILETGNVYPG